MTDALFLVDALPLADLYTLDGPEGHHAATVVRLRTGERVVLGDGRGGTAEATVTAVGRGTVTLVVQRRSYSPAPDPRLTVVQGLPKGDRGELAVQAMTEVGVDSVVPWSAARSVAQWRGERGERSRQRWVDTAREAAKQARRAWLPQVHAVASLSTVVDMVEQAALALVLHEEAIDQLSTVDFPAAGEVVLVVGPEGGIAPDELTRLAGAGAHPVRLGPTVLRTSTAGVAALAVASVRLGRW